MKSIKIFLTFLISLLVVLPLFGCSCYDGPEDNCVFINEKVNVHKEFIASVKSVQMVNEITIMQNKADTEKTVLIGTDCHYLEVVLLLQHQNTKVLNDNHVFDKDDFKIKDHTGVRLKNIYFQSVKDGLALSNKDFKTKKAIEDYTWVGKTIEYGEEQEIILYFMFEKDMSVDTTLMILEIDFSSTKTGSDIVLANRTEQNEEQ